MEQTKTMLTTREVEKHYGIRRKTLDRRAKEGKINKYRFGESGRKVYWKKEEIEMLFMRLGKCEICGAPAIDDTAFIFACKQHRDACWELTERFVDRFPKFELWGTDDTHKFLKDGIEEIKKEFNIK